jgi:hypothetical protein
METLKLARFHGKVKFAGILFCVAGVSVLAFYDGPMFRSLNNHHLFQNGNTSSAGDAHSKTQWVFGIFLMTLSNVLAGLWTVLQVERIKFQNLFVSMPVQSMTSRMNVVLLLQGPLIEDTSKLMNTTLQISCASVQAFVVAVAAERDLSKWKLGWNVSLAAIIYSVIKLNCLNRYSYSKRNGTDR